MPKEHVVREGECLNSLADAYGFRTVEVIRDLPENAPLWQEREGNFNVLLPGDRVFIPDFDTRTEVRSTGSRHTFVVRGPLRTWFHCRVDLPGTHRYELTVDGADAFSGTVERGNVIRHLIPARAATGKLHLWALPANPTDPPRLTWDLLFGHLAPISEVRGVQQRLANLGFDPGPADGLASHTTRDAICTFQRSKQLPETGAVEDVRAPLREAYGE